MSRFEKIFYDCYEFLTALVCFPVAAFVVWAILILF